MGSISCARIKPSGDLMTNIINQQSTPFFLATLSGSISNVTGDGTTYTCLFDTLSSGSGYNTLTGVFTCSVPGDYLFIARIHILGATASHTLATANFVTNLGSYQSCDFNLATGRTNTGTMMFPSATFPFVNMAIGDTVKVDIRVANGTKVVTLGTLSQFQGARIP